MNKKYIVLVVAIIGAGILYKRSMEGMKPSESSVAADMITLISNDGKKFQISREAAEPSHTISTILNSNSETKEFPFKLLHGTVLEKMVSLLEELKAEKDKRKNGFNLDDFVIELFARSNIQELPDLAIAADFLQVDGLANSLMRFYIFQSLKANHEITVDEIQRTINKPVLNRIIQKEYSVVKSSAGFRAFGVAINFRGTLDLSSRRITNAYGLSLIQNKDKILELDLSKNQLKDLPLGIFNGLSNLEFLNLDNNQLHTLPIGLFDGISNLLGLWLNENQLKDLPVGIFHKLIKLNRLELNNNQLVNLPAGMFGGLTLLMMLNLENNQLKNLSIGAFAGLSSLQLLRLNENQLEDLPVGIFQGLSSLQGLNLYDNKLRDLPAGIFNGLTSLEELRLNNNKLKSLHAEVFNELTKLVLLVILDENDLGMTEDQIRALLDPAIRARVRIK